MQDSAAIPPFVIPQQRRTATQTPASSFIHDLPVQEKKKKNLLSKIISFFFFKAGDAFQFNPLPRLHPGGRKRWQTVVR